MRIKLKKVSKRFQYKWIFKDVELDLAPNRAYAITGPNGSGKSTLLRVISGQLHPSAGEVSYERENHPLEVEAVYRHLSFAAPYIDLIEDFSLSEMLKFHRAFKNFQSGLDDRTLKAILNLSTTKNQPVKYYSSGMKQRLKLLLAICSDTEVLLLDEPTTNLDKPGAKWYAELLEKYAHDRLVIIASNVESDYAYCREVIDVVGFKDSSRSSSKVTSS